MCSSSNVCERVCVCVCAIYPFCFSLFIFELLLFDCLVVLLLLLLLISVSSSNRMIHICGLTVCVVIRFLESSPHVMPFIQRLHKSNSNNKDGHDDDDDKMSQIHSEIDMKSINTFIRSSTYQIQFRYNWNNLVCKNEHTITLLTCFKRWKNTQRWLKQRLETPNYSDS